MRSYKLTSIEMIEIVPRGSEFGRNRASKLIMFCRDREKKRGVEEQKFHSRIKRFRDTDKKERKGYMYIRRKTSSRRGNCPNSVGMVPVNVLLAIRFENQMTIEIL